MPTILPENSSQLELLAQALSAETHVMKLLGDKDNAITLADSRGDCIYEIIRALHDHGGDADIAETIGRVLADYIVDYGIFSRSE